MRQKTLQEPNHEGLSVGDEWISPDGHSPTFRKVWTGDGWESPDESIEEEEELEEEDEIEDSDDDTPNEDLTDEQRLSTTLQTGDGGVSDGGPSGNKELPQRWKSHPSKKPPKKKSKR